MRQLPFDFESRPPPHNGTPTSQAAAESIRGRVTADALAVLEAIREAGRHGRTCDECEVLLAMRHQTCSARINGLLEARWIECNGLTRSTRSGRPARVYVAIEG